MQQMIIAHHRTDLVILYWLKMREWSGMLIVVAKIFKGESYIVMNLY